MDKWLEYLNIIKLAIRNFPCKQEDQRIRTSRRRGLTRNPASTSSIPSDLSKASTPASASDDSTNTATASPSGLVKRNQAATFRCHIRDNSQCVVTGRPSTQGFPLEGAHIIPYAFANHPNCRTLAFWRTLDLFYGVKATDSIFDTLVANVNNLGNLVSLERTTHGMFDTGRLTLTPMTMDYVPITVFNEHSGSYFLRVNYPYGSPTSGLITSTRIVGAPPGVYSLEADYLVPILYDPQATNYTSPIPQPTYFALRLLLLELQRLVPAT